RPQRLLIADRCFRPCAWLPAGGPPQLIRRAFKAPDLRATLRPQPELLPHPRVWRMAKSMVEKYEQILSADPGSMVFVELAKALLHKGLHRSALPILKKAVALQPNDNRVRQWLDQTTRALNGEKVTAQPMYTSVDPPPASESTAPGQPSLPAMGDPTVTDA